MVGFSSWIISITCICVLSILIDLILPEGKINAHIKVIFAFLIMLVIISPIPQIISGKTIDISSLYSDKIVLQDNYIYQINRDKLDKIENNIQDELTKNGIEGVVVKISADIFEYNMEINAVFVDLFDLVIKPDFEHIDIKTSIIDCIIEHVKIDKEKILFND